MGRFKRTVVLSEFFCFVAPGVDLVVVVTALAVLLAVMVILMLILAFYLAGWRHRR